jgi:hypothetical protein
MTTVVDVFIPGTFRLGGIWPVAQHLRPVRHAHWQPDFCPVFQRLDQPIDRPFWKLYDYIESMALGEALTWPIVGEA